MDGGAALAAKDAPAGPAWTDAKLEAYLELQQALVAQLTEPHPSDDALAASEARLRKASGLTDAEVDTLNRLTAALVTRRMMIQVAEMGSMAKELARTRAELPDGSVPEVDSALQAMAERKKREGAYLEQRARFGDALIDVALPHEDALIQHWGAMMRAAHQSGEAREGEH
jgi:hypothetical protein